MSLTLGDLLARVKRNVPSITMDTEIQDAILERMNYLVTLDTFPFQQKYQTATLPSGEYRLATPDDFAIVNSVVIWMSDDKERHLDIWDSTEFSRVFTDPAEINIGIPDVCCIRVAEKELWFNCPADGDLVVRMEFTYIPSDATDVNITQLTELAKLALVKWASADAFRMMGEHDRADLFEADGNKFLAAMEKRYQLALEQDARFISPQEAHKLSRRT
jgi:hypothetical protein